MALSRGSPVGRTRRARPDRGHRRTCRTLRRADGCSAVIRRRPVAVYRVIDEEELLGTSGAGAPSGEDFSSGASQSRDAPPTAPRRPWLGRRSLLVLGVSLLVVAGAVVFGAHPGRSSAVDHRGRSSLLHSTVALPQATVMPAPRGVRRTHAVSRRRSRSRAPMGRHNVDARRRRRAAGAAVARHRRSRRLGALRRVAAAPVLERTLSAPPSPAREFGFER